MDNLKCFSDHVSTHASVDFIDACETLRKELLKSMKIAKKFKEELKLANLEKEELIVRLNNIFAVLIVIFLHLCLKKKMQLDNNLFYNALYFKVQSSKHVLFICIRAVVEVSFA